MSNAKVRAGSAYAFNLFFFKELVGLSALCSLLFMVGLFGGYVKEFLLRTSLLPLCTYNGVQGPVSSPGEETANLKGQK